MFKDKSELAADTEAISKMQPLAQSLEEELNEVAREVKAKEMNQKKQLLDVNMKQYEIKGTEHEWSDALKLPASSSYVTVKRLGEKRKQEVDSHFDAKEKSTNDNFDKNPKKKGKGSNKSQGHKKSKK